MNLLFFVRVVFEEGFRARERGGDLLFRGEWPEESWPTLDASPGAIASWAKLAVSHLLHKLCLEKKA